MPLDRLLVVPMKSRSSELVDRAIAAAIASIEVYNKPDFPYRGETFAVLAINSWELLLKAKWLMANNNKLASLHVMEPREKLDGTKSLKMRIKKTRSGNPFTHSLDYLGKKLVEAKHLDETAWKNLELLIEMRDCSIHFYNRGGAFLLRLQEIGAASLKNFVTAVGSWFGRDLTKYNFYLMPLSFVSLPTKAEGIVLNAEEKRFLAFIDRLDTGLQEPDSPYSVTINIDIKFTRSTARDAPGIQITSDPNAPEVRLTDSQILDKYPWSYDRLTAECKKRYLDFKQDKKYHNLRKTLLADKRKRFGMERYLDPDNTRSTKKAFYSPNILQELDKHYIQALL
jgi:hypothetical protein